jgi:NADH-quinone oxidoreductase subunit J
MNAAFVIIAIVTLVGAVAAMSLRNLVHCALCLVVTFGGLAALYLQLDAQFVGLAQILVYIGAVAILIVFAILLTRGSEPPQQPVWSPAPIMGVCIAVLAFGSLAACVLSSFVALTPNTPKADVTADVSVKNIGARLMTDYVLPLEVVGLLLTAALIGAVIIAMREKTGRESEGSQSH